MSALRSVLGISIVVAIGCGGSTSSDSVGEGGASSGSGEGSGATGDDSSVGASNDSSVSGGDDSSVAVGDDSGLSTVGPDGSLVTPPPDDDAGGTGPVDGGPGVTTPPRGSDGGADQIECGATPCDSKSQVCCLATRSCIANNAVCRGGDTLSCSGTNSCAMGVCCQEATGRTTYTSRCEIRCPAGATQLCTTDADCTGTDEACVRNGNYGVCERLRTPPPIPDGGIVLPGRDAGIPLPPLRDGGR
jgi:hypothetical protein